MTVYLRRVLAILAGSVLVFAFFAALIAVVTWNPYLSLGVLCGFLGWMIADIAGWLR